MLQGNWKIEYQNSPRENPEGSWNLYKLDEDPTELTDLSKEFPEVLQGLIKQYEAWALRTGVEEDYNSLLLARPL
jgi:arylsulfatase